MMKGLKKTVSVAMQADVYDQLKGLAKETGRTLPAYIRQVLKVYLEYQENGLNLLD